MYSHTIAFEGKPVCFALYRFWGLFCNLKQNTYIQQGR